VSPWGRRVSRALLLFGTVLFPARADAQENTERILSLANGVYDALFARQSVTPQRVTAVVASVEEISAPTELDTLIKRGVLRNLEQLAIVLESIPADTTLRGARNQVTAWGLGSGGDGRLVDRVRSRVAADVGEVQARQLRQVAVAQDHAARVSILSLYQNLIALTNVWQQRRPDAPLPKPVAARRFGGTAAAYGTSAFAAGAAMTWGVENGSWIAQAEFAVSTDSVRGSEVSLAFGREAGIFAILAGASYGPDRETELAPAATFLVRFRPGAYVGAALSAEHGMGFRVLLIPARWRR
jgi:hypothetical protein